LQMLLDARESLPQLKTEGSMEKMTCCIISHNMIIEDEPDIGEENFRYTSNGDPVEQEHDTEIPQCALTHREPRDPHSIAR
jgi:hypothetical protein